MIIKDIKLTIKMICPKCKSELKRVEIEDAKTPAISYQCKNCDYYNFEHESIMKIIDEIKQKELH